MIVAEPRAWAALSALLLALGAHGCASSNSSSVPSSLVSPEPFTVIVPARGVLEAITATPVRVPEVNARLRLSWLADDGFGVAQENTVAQLDDRDVLDDIERLKRRIEIADLEIQAREREQKQQKQALASEVAEVEETRRMANEFARKDETIFSRQEIIESQLNIEGLDAKLKLFKERQQRLVAKHTADLELLRLKKQTQVLRLGQLETARASLDLKAPHAGFFLQGRNWWGDPYRTGANVWGGMKLGELPDVSSMQAKVHVLESDAAGLAVGQAAEIELDALPGRSFKGQVKTVEAVAQALVEESPVKYFQIVLSIEGGDPLAMKPGREVRARITVQREGALVSIPNQALFHKGDENWVHVQVGDRFVRRDVRLGQRSLTRTVVVEGLSKGERVALSEPLG